MKRNYKVIRAYADADRRYWCECRVFEKPDAMRRDIERATGTHPGRDCAGQVSSASHRVSGRLLGVFAVMWLNRVDLHKRPTELCAHEATHAAIRYFERRGWTTCLAHESDAARLDGAERWHEERLAYAVGRISREVVRGLYRLRVFA